MTTERLQIANPAANEGPSTRFLLMLWGLAGALACVLSLRQFASALSAGAFIPVDNDSFYHAHRIIDALATPGALQQFDPRIHAPDGSWITWPWAYDMLMAFLDHVAVMGLGVADPLKALAWVAPIWVFVNVGLFISIARQLAMPARLMAAATLCYAASPLTMLMHRFGMLDHHYVEHTFVLGAVSFGLLWFRDMRSMAGPVALGAWLGAAPAFHNGLFIMQVPVLATLGARWVFGRTDQSRSVAVFAASLLTSTLLFLLPSEPFRRLMFSFSLQSWFHLYVAFATAVLSLAFAFCRRSFAAGAGIVVAAVALLLPITGQLAVGTDYLTAGLVDLDEVMEVKGIFGYIRDHQTGFLLSLYGGLLLLLFPALLWLVMRSWRRLDDAGLFLVIAALFGAALMTDQLRLENYGSFALFLLPFLAIDRLAQRWPVDSRVWGGVALALILGSVLPTLPRLSETIASGGSNGYRLAEPLYRRLASACHQQPGIVLASSSDGHPITYFTDCPVLADNFIITRQHEEKLVEVNQLMASSLDQVLAQAPYVRYIYVARADDVYASHCGIDCPQNDGLRRQLLSGPGTDFPRLRLIGEARMNGPGGSDPFTIGRLFQVLPAARSPAP